MQSAAPHTLVAMPGLDELAEHPERVRELPAQAAKDLLARLVGLQTLLLAQCFTAEPAATPSGEDAFLSVSQVAARLSVPKSYAYELCRQRKLRAVRMGKYIRVSERALADYQAKLSQN